MSLSSIRCRILGQAEIHTRGIRLTPESELQFGLALYFCAQAGREVPRDELASLFWPKHDVEAGRHCLRQAIYRLRVLGVAVRSGARASVLDTDVVDADFAPVIAEDARAAAFLQLDDVTILPGYAPRFSRPFSHWVEDFRGEISSRMRRGLVRAISEMRARGRYADVERLCRFCLRLDPLNEEATLALAESVALAGSKAEAVGLIDQYEGEVGRYRPDLRISSSLLRERISDRLIRHSQAPVDLPMIGREQDVERVLSAFQRLRGNQAVSYVITGVAGVGKTRLASECCRMAELQGARLLTVETQPSSRTQALFAVSQLIDGLLQMPGAIGCAPAALECLRAMASPVSMRAPSTLESDGEARFAMVRWSILDVLDAILNEGPLVIHVDDAHQLDELSQSILHDALQTHAHSPLLLLFTMRSPEQGDSDRFDRLRNVSTLHDLLPLNDASCELLVSRFSVLHEGLDAATRERIIRLSGGNPFFLVELLKHRSELVTDEIPVTVQALLEDRLARLSPIATTVLRAAAVLGLSSTVKRLHLMVARHTTEMLSALNELHVAGMLCSSDDGIICRHDAIREVVLNRTPTAARVLLHRRAARLIGREALQEGGVALLWEAVDHSRRALSQKERVRYVLVLASRLLALGLANDALAVLNEIDSPSNTNAQRLLIFRRKAVASRMLRDWSSVHEAIRNWRSVFKDLGRLPEHHTRMELLEFECYYNSPQTFGSIPPEVYKCISDSKASTRHRLAAATLAMIAAANDGDEVTARRVFENARTIVPDSTTEIIERLSVEAIFHSDFGDIGVAPAILRKIVSEALKVSHPIVRAAHIRRASFGIARYDDPIFATDLLVTALKTFEDLRLWPQAVVCIEDLGLLALARGAFDDALKWIEKAQEMRPLGNDVFSAAIEYELRVMLAFEQMDSRQLPTFTLPCEVSEAFLRSRRSRQIHFALQAAVRIVSKDLAGLLASLPEMHTLHERMKTRGNQDFCVAVLATALSDLGREEDAGILLERYFTVERREQTAPSIALQRVAAHSGISCYSGNPIAAC